QKRGALEESEEGLKTYNSCDSDRGVAGGMHTSACCCFFEYYLFYGVE
ncbi:unnamed protein product, partial [Urochloa humidicola]